MLHKEKIEFLLNHIWYFMKSNAQQKVQTLNKYSYEVYFIPEGILQSVENSNFHCVNWILQNYCKILYSINK